MSGPDKKSRNLAYSAALAAMIFSALLVAAKAWAWLTGNSAAMLSSLVDSSVDTLVSFTNFLALRFAFMPADDDHRYGHGKAEGIAALAQAAFIAGSCVFVVLEAINRFGTSESVQAIDLNVQVLICGMVGAIILNVYQRWVALRTKSLAVEADSAHYASDVALNIGIITSLLVGQQQDLVWLDPAVALLVAAWLLWNARGIALKALDMLLDREVEDHVRLAIKKEILGTAGVESMHDLRTRRSGQSLLVSFDIEVAPDLSLLDAHDISKQVEDRVLTCVDNEFPHTEVMIHIDPRGDVSDSRHKKLKDFHAR
ncbi:MAG TPA: cation diffusion facilitator family transporter [Alphaproteobacteria bacterium]